MGPESHDIYNIKCPLYGIPRPNSYFYDIMVQQWQEDPEYRKNHEDPSGAFDWSKCTCKETPS